MKCAYCGVRISDLRKHRRENSRCNRYYFEHLTKVVKEALEPCDCEKYTAAHNMREVGLEKCPKCGRKLEEPKAD